MNLRQFPIVLVTGAILAAQSPQAAHAQAVAFPVEEATIARHRSGAGGEFRGGGIGTDTGGSVRAPSAHNALAGLRPTVGLVSRTGMTPNNSVRDTAGPMARNVADMAILLGVIVGPDSEDPATARADGHRLPTYMAALKTDALKGARLGVLRQVFGPAVTDPRIIAQFETTLAELKAAGAEIVDPLVVPVLDAVPRPPQTSQIGDNRARMDQLASHLARTPPRVIANPASPSPQKAKR